MRNPRNESLGSANTEQPASPLQNAHDELGGSERRCVLTGRQASRDALLRLALSPDDAVAPDALARAPGRGAWVGVSREELSAALENGKLRSALARAFKTGKLSIPDNLPELLEAALRKSLSERLGLEMRAGRLILGSERIAGEARAGSVAALFHASDASEDGSRKLDQAWRVGMDAEGSGMTGKRLPLDREALSVALGRENVVHLALADAKSAERVAVPLGRLQNYLGAAPAAETRDEREAG